MQTAEYAAMLQVSAKKTEEVAELKWKRDNARHAGHTELAHRYKAGELQKELAAAEAAYGSRKQKGKALLLPNA